MSGNRSSERASLLAPFEVRSFRFQWPADLLTSWAFEMETLILGWYVLVETESVLWLTVFASLQYLGTLIAPMLGVAGDRAGRRTMLCAMRAVFALLAAVLMTLALADLLTVYHVITIALLAGMMRPSDMMMRNVLIGDTMPANRLMNAMGVSRTTMDSARVAGALIGAGLFSVLGIGPAYIFVTAFYVLSFLLTLGVSNGRAALVASPDRPSPWADLKAGLAYVWATPTLLGAMWLAFLVNLTAYPLSHGLLPYVAREVYRIDENGLGHLVASVALGALVGSIAMAITGGWRRPARSALINTVAWYALLLVFGFSETKLPGLFWLFLVGLFQSIAMIALSVTLLHTAPAEFRGRVMGVRMLAVYGLPLGLLASSFFIDRFDFSGTIAIYGAVGIAFTLAIAVKWRRALWD